MVNTIRVHRGHFPMGVAGCLRLGVGARADLEYNMAGLSSMSWKGIGPGGQALDDFIWYF